MSRARLAVLLEAERSLIAELEALRARIEAWERLVSPPPARPLLSLVRSDEGSERKRPKNARRGAQEARTGAAGPSPSPAPRPARWPARITTGGEPR